MSSVGRICDAGFKIVFDRKGYQIFQGKNKIIGRKVHKGFRDTKSGLYPLVLFQPKKENGSHNQQPQQEIKREPQRSEDPYLNGVPLGVALVSGSMFAKVCQKPCAGI